jgi:hypothetical protein
LSIQKHYPTPEWYAGSSRSHDAVIRVYDAKSRHDAAADEPILTDSGSDPLNSVELLLAISA